MRYTVWTNKDIIDNPLCNVEKTIVYLQIVLRKGSLMFTFVILCIFFKTYIILNSFTFLLKVFSSFDFLHVFFQILTLSCLNLSHHDAKSLNGSSQPLLYQSPSSFFQFTSSLLPVSSSLLPIHFQSTSSFHPDSSQLPRVHFCVNFFLSMNCGLTMTVSGNIFRFG